MNNNINNKTSPNQMRILMKRMRDGKYKVNEAPQEEKKKNLNMRDMLKITRNLNEAVEDNMQEKQKNKKTAYDQTQEEEKFRNYFKDLNVDIKFNELEIYDNLIYWGATIDGTIQFVYSVTPYEKTSRIKFKYSDDFSVDNPDNQEIVKKIEEYYDIFYKYWRNNILEQ